MVIFWWKCKFFKRNLNHVYYRSNNLSPFVIETCTTLITAWKTIGCFFMVCLKRWPSKANFLSRPFSFTYLAWIRFQNSFQNKLFSISICILTNNKIPHKISHLTLWEDFWIIQSRKFFLNVLFYEIVHKEFSTNIVKSADFRKDKFGEEV